MIKKIVVFDSEFSECMIEVSQKFPKYEFSCANVPSDLSDLDLQNSDILISKSSTISKSVIDHFSNVEMIVKMGRCYQNIDYEYARNKNIKLIAVPRKGPNCVAELGITLILALSKDLIISHSSVVNAAYRYRGLRPIVTSQTKMAFHWMGNRLVHEIRNKSLGIIGMGEIGCELARRANIMGMKVYYYKRTPLVPELEGRFEASFLQLPDLMATCDYICLAVPQTPETEGMITAQLFNKMKPSSYFVNICRGGNIDEDALINVLQTKQIAGAALDVFVEEPLPENNPLLKLDNVILTPHIGGGSGTNRTLELIDTVEEIERVLNGEKPQLNFS